MAWLDRATETFWYYGTTISIVIISISILGFCIIALTRWIKSTYEIGAKSSLVGKLAEIENIHSKSLPVHKQMITVRIDEDDLLTLPIRSTQITTLNQGDIVRITDYRRKRYILEVAKDESV